MLGSPNPRICYEAFFAIPRFLPEPLIIFACDVLEKTGDKMIKGSRRAAIINRAFELAESGKHSDYLSLENSLVSGGFPEARAALDNDALRDDIAEICIRTRKS